MDLDNLKHAFNLEPKEAIEFFRSLGIEPSENWEDTLKAVLDDSFAIAGVKNMDILLDLKNEIEEAISSGKDFKDFKKELISNIGLRNWHADLVIKQNISNSYHAGSYLRQNETTSLLPYIRFVLGGSEKHTEGCKWLTSNKIAVALDDPSLNQIYPPRHFRCGTVAKAVSKKWLERNEYKIYKVKDIPKNLRNSVGFNHLPNTPFSEKINLDDYPSDLSKKYKESIEK